MMYITFTTHTQAQVRLLTPPTIKINLPDHSFDHMETICDEDGKIGVFAPTRDTLFCGDHITMYLFCFRYSYFYVSHTSGVENPD